MNYKPFVAGLILSALAGASHADHVVEEPHGRVKGEAYEMRAGVRVYHFSASILFLGLKTFECVGDFKSAELDAALDKGDSFSLHETYDNAIHSRQRHIVLKNCLDDFVEIDGKEVLKK